MSVSNSARNLWAGPGGPVNAAAVDTRLAAMDRIRFGGEGAVGGVQDEAAAGARAAPVSPFRPPTSKRMAGSPARVGLAAGAVRRAGPSPHPRSAPARRPGGS